MKLKELRKLSKTVRTILVGLFTLGFSIVIVMLTGVILFQNELMNTVQFIAFQAFCMAMLAVVAVVFNLFKDINFDVQVRLNKALRRIRKRNAQNRLAAVADAGHTAPSLQLINNDNQHRLRKQA